MKAKDLMNLDNGSYLMKTKDGFFKSSFVFDYENNEKFSLLRAENNKDNANYALITFPEKLTDKKIEISRYLSGMKLTAEIKISNIISIEKTN